MDSNQLATAIEAASLETLSEIGKLVCDAALSGTVSESEAQHLFECIHARRHRTPLAGKPATRRGIYPPKRPVPAYDRSKSILRRRALAAMAPLPRSLVPNFTLSQLAVMRVILGEIAARGDCRLCVGAIAGKAGVSETTVRDTIRLAVRLALVLVERRPQFRKPNLPNVIRLVSAELREWLDHPRWKATGYKNSEATDSKSLSKAKRANQNPERRADTEKISFGNMAGAFPAPNLGSLAARIG